MKNKILAPILCSYMILLVVAAWPSNLTPAFLRPVPIASAKALDSVGILAGAPVFTMTQSLPTRMKALFRCLNVSGESPNGGKEKLFPTSACPPEGFRWRVDPFDTMMEHLLIKIFESYGTPRGARLQASLGDYFCKRGHARITIDSKEGFVDYQTGERLAGERKIAVYDCKRRSLIK